jgi:hypothetical protein
MDKRKTLKRFDITNFDSCSDYRAYEITIGKGPFETQWLVGLIGTDSIRQSAKFVYIVARVGDGTDRVIVPTGVYTGLGPKNVQYEDYLQILPKGGLQKVCHVRYENPVNLGRLEHLMIDTLLAKGDTPDPHPISFEAYINDLWQHLGDKGIQ